MSPSPLRCHAKQLFGTFLGEILATSENEHPDGVVPVEPAAPDPKGVLSNDIDKLFARDWLTERLSIQEYRDRWIPIRDLWLEIFVILLIGGEIVLGITQERNQTADFKAEQQMLAKTLSASRHSSWLDERPWVTPVVAEAPKFTDINQPVKISLRLENSGKTPANLTGGHFSFFAYKNGEEDSLLHPRRELSGMITGGFVNPGAHITLAAIPAVYPQSGQGVINTNEFLEDLKKGSVYLMGHGKIKYVDVWKVDHWIQFCAVIGTQQIHSSCTDYNQMDNNEPKEE
jgi:hypothetical protein